jgi:hypothetical protein
MTNTLAKSNILIFPCFTGWFVMGEGKIGNFSFSHHKPSCETGGCLISGPVNENEKLWDIQPINGLFMGFVLMLMVQ